MFLMDKTMADLLINNTILVYMIISLIIMVIFTRKNMTKKVYLYTWHIIAVIIIIVLLEISESIVSSKATELVELATLEEGAIPLPSNFTSYTTARTVLTILKYVFYPLIPYFIILLYEPNKLPRIIMPIIIAINDIIYETSPLHHWTFWIGANDNSWHEGPLHSFVYYTCIILIIYLVISFYWNHRRDKKVLIEYSIVGFLIMCAMLIESIMGYNAYYLLDSAIVGGLLFYYISNNYLSNRDRLEIQDINLKNKQNELMMSQIKPHFIYNTLNTIYALCDEDPEKAKDTIAKFSKYLRTNLDMKNNLIPLNQEIDHCRNYSDIEMQRFRNIKVTFDIQDSDFLVPSLSVQPMIENAIKHGVRSKNPGLVNIKTYQDDKNHYIVIEDNGIGFDLTKLKDIQENKVVSPTLDVEGHAHIGLSNVKERIEKMVKGTFTIETVTGEGTTITMAIPK